MAGLSIWHILLFAVVVILLFGTSKLKNIGKDVGGAIKDFKKSVRDEEAPVALEHRAETLDPNTVNTTNKTQLKN